MSNTTRPIAAKFSGRCPCGLAIAVGESIIFRPGAARGERALHPLCAKISAALSRIAAAGLRSLMNGGADEPHWVGVAAELEADLARMAQSLTDLGGSLEAFTGVEAALADTHFTKLAAAWRRAA